MVSLINKRTPSCIQKQRIVIFFGQRMERWKQALEHTLSQTGCGWGVFVEFRSVEGGAESSLVLHTPVAHGQMRVQHLCTRPVSAILNRGAMCSASPQGAGQLSGWRQFPAGNSNLMCYSQGLCTGRSVGQLKLD